MRGLQTLPSIQGLRIPGIAAAILEASALPKFFYNRSHFTKPARVSLTSPPDRINKQVIIMNPAGAGGGPGSKAFIRRLFGKQKQMGLEDRGSAVRGLQALPSSQGRWIPGTAATILEASALLQLYINGAISQIRQGYPLRDLRIALIKRVIIINAGGAGVPGSKAIFRRLFCLQKQRGLGQRLCCERAAGFALKPGTPDSRNCSSYSGGLCLTKTLYKGSHFTKPARVSLPSPPDQH